MTQFALDRSIDVDGRLHIPDNLISKATVNPYFGHEIPGWQELGLDPDKVYNLLRPPEELDKAKETFNNIPVLSEHVPVSADDHAPDLVIGSTGTDAVFDGTYLCNSVVIWAQEFIDRIEAGEQAAWSCGYRYKPILEPGEYLGLQYDGKMIDIAANHLALVKNGRAGPEIVVGDTMKKFVLDGLKLFIDPKLTKPVDFSGAMDAKAIFALVKPKLAKDAELTDKQIEDMISTLEAMARKNGEDNLDPEVDAEDDDDDLMDFLQGKLSDDDYLTAKKLYDAGNPTDPKTMDDVPADDPKKQDKAYTMDSGAILREVAAINEALQAIEPIVGKLKTHPASASGVYKIALDARKIDTRGVHPSAFKSLVAMLPVNTETPNVTAQDEKVDLDALFPDRSKFVEV